MKICFNFKKVIWFFVIVCLALEVGRIDHSNLTPEPAGLESLAEDQKKKR